MPFSNRLLTSLLACVLALHWASVAEGYYSESKHRAIGPKDNAVEAAKPTEEVGEQTKNVAKASRHGEEKQYETSQTKREHIDAKYPFIHMMHERLKTVLGKRVEEWWMDWKLWVGLASWLAVWAKWLILGYDDPFAQRAIFAFGINVLILHHLQYAISIQAGMYVVCFALACQALFQSWVWSKAEDDAEPLTDFEADTLYLDLALPAEQIIVLFIAQVSVWWFYMTSILGNFNFNHCNYLFWFMAFLAMQMTMIFNRGDESVLGAMFPIHDVFKMVKSADRSTFKLRDDATAEPFLLSKVNVSMRGATGFFCNTILREIMAYTIPLMLMGFSEPMDFVVYCVGVNFICTLDDMSKRSYVLLDVTARRDEDLESGGKAKMPALSETSGDKGSNLQ